MTQLRCAVCQSPAELLAKSPTWDALCDAVHREAPDMLLLNELPFGEWVSWRRTFNAAAWVASLGAHEAGLTSLHELQVDVVAGTRPRLDAHGRVNEAFVWTKDAISGAHTKQQFPDEPGFYEAQWFVAGERHFRCVNAGGLRVGFLICTEVMFNENARAYGRSGAQVLLVPRAVGGCSLARWLVACRMAAIVSGCYVLSSNRAGVSAFGQEFGGASWIIDPFGELVAETSAERPVISHVIDTARVEVAQAGYPCYVRA